MGCEKLPLGDGNAAIVCSRGRRRSKCSSCGAANAPFLCDARVREKRSGTCDAPVCASCAVEVGADRHLCPTHAGLTSTSFVPFQFGLRAITVRQPFASALVYGPKRVENRSKPLTVNSPDWAPDARGDRWVAIHSGRELYDLDAEGAHWLRGLWSRLPMTEEGLPMSALLGFARVRGWVEHDGDASDLGAAETERVLFDPWAVGPWCMVLDRMTALATPIAPVRGALGLWSVPDAHLETFRSRYREVEGTWQT